LVKLTNVAFGFSIGSISAVAHIWSSMHDSFSASCLMLKALLLSRRGPCAKSGYVKVSLRLR